MPQVARVYLYDEYVGLLEKKAAPLFRFTYDSDYLKKPEARALSLSLPLQKAHFESPQLFPYFAGLLTEGWLKKIQQQTQKVDEHNLMERLLRNGRELLGAVRIEEVSE